MKQSTALLLALAVAAVTTTSPAAAQRRLPIIPTPPGVPTQPVVKELRPSVRGRQEEVPPSHRPPPGMCRIWLDSVPAGQQPAPTDCASAVRNRPANGRVLFGDDYVDGKEKGSKEKRPAPPARPRSDSTSADARHAPVPGVAAYAAPRFLPAAHVATRRAGWAFATGQGTGPATGPATGRATAQDSVRPRRQARPTARERAHEREQGRAREAERARDARRDLEARRSEEARSAAEARRVIEERRAERRRDLDDDEDVRPLRPGAARDPRDPRDARDARDRRDPRDDVRRSGDRVVITGPGSDPRYYDERYAAPNRANGTCLDRNRDGWCDDARADAGVCLDRDGDGRCDDYGALATAPYTSELPPMRAGADVRGGAGSPTALRWLGTAEVIARTTDLDRDGVPERVVWLDANSGQLVQVWTDRDRDGIADRVEVYRGGRRIKLFGR